MQLDTIVHSEALTFTKSLPDESVDCVVTSPPYYGLRDYGTDGQMGLEGKPDCGKTGLMKLRSDLSIADLMYVLKRLSDAGILYDGRNGNDDTK